MLTDSEIRDYKYLIQIESLINGYYCRPESTRPWRFTCVQEELNRAMQDLKREIGDRLIEEWIHKERD